ncbi:hypothetical protein CANTEDRAFT_114141 [Yamadazyma tenuis ATCC 10573]|uniref:Uncharacterized protein n=1 Tax=Candida tenuis (strain ATCC 10573 / BCRC 21748 / CBS 615 / JCM 9827 / NBRC 10315 / NRRL Y-1498 / VKM Y-70) TaxID=590646 RepID=G3B391_CANTC|nr:uncharacterized protein CANTEDRAFT_114141 [Yamadazyma tenuis ATCC 10573]EGV64110.1 hypothetical protein CANTEDRAFT_114141 [Yamadazyma tenuis ATCC 10573]
MSFRTRITQLFKSNNTSDRKDRYPGKDHEIESLKRTPKPMEKKGFSSSTQEKMRIL